MPIERLIHGSINLVDDGTLKAGYQCYAMTPGMQSMSSALIDSLTATYEAPKMDDYKVEFDKAVLRFNADDQKRNDLANEYSKIAKELQPASLSFSLRDINGTNRYVLIYGKDMGISWDGARPFGAYHSLVICDSNDINIYPILLCSSSIVCCDIPRDEFFPKSDSVTFVSNEKNLPAISGPVVLDYLPTLDGKNDVKLNHSSGFSEISNEALMTFIQTGDRIEILKSMISALIMLKSGNENCRIVIADEKDSILKWIAAITYVFPLDLALDISFSSYRYKIDNSFDISGVYIAELNGYTSTKGFNLTDYDFNALHKNYAVYDFQKQKFAPQVEIYDNLFISMVENTFSINRQIIDGYKAYIISSTTYRKIDSSYMDGAILYMFLEKNKRLAPKQMKLALTFAKQYATQKEKKRIFDRIISAYKEYTSDSNMLDVIVEFIRYCVDQNIARQNDVESIFMNDAKIAFLDFANYSFDSFSIQGSIAERLCGFNPGQMEIALVTTIGTKKLFDLMDELQKYREVQRISYIHTALCHYVNANKGSFKHGTYEEKIVAKIINVFIVGETLDNENRLNTLIDKTNKIISDDILQFYYADIAYRTVSHKGYKSISENVAEQVAKAYISLNSEQRKNYINAINMSEASKTYLKVILLAIRSEYEPSERITVLTEALTNNRNVFSEFVLPIKRIAIDTAGYTVSSSFYYKVFYFFKFCEKYYGKNIDRDEMGNLISNYINLLYSEHRNFIVDEKTIKELKDLNHEFEIVRNDGTSLTIVNAFLLISEMSHCTESRKPCVFNGHSNVPPISLNKLKNTEQSSLIESASNLIAAYWLNTERAPILDKMFAFDSDIQQQKTYTYLLGEILDNILKSKSRNRYDIAAQVIEYGIFYRLTTFLSDLPEMLANNIKQNDILKPLEKDIDLKSKQKAQKGILSQIDTIEIQEVVHSIKDAYEEKAQNSTFGKAKRVLGNIVSGFKKGKKDE